MNRDFICFRCEVEYELNEYVPVLFPNFWSGKCEKLILIFWIWVNIIKSGRDNLGLLTENKVVKYQSPFYYEKYYSSHALGSMATHRGNYTWSVERRIMECTETRP